MIDVDEVRHELKTGLPYLAELVFRVAAATTDAPNAEVPGGQALYMTGPTADAEAFTWREMSVLMGRLDEGAIEPARPGDPPSIGFWFGRWEADLREAEGAEPYWALGGRSGWSFKYVQDRIDWMLRVMPDGTFQYPEVEDRHRELGKIISRLEDVIFEGQRDDKGAPCPGCGVALVRRWAGDGEPVADDRYICRRCDGVSLAPDEYADLVRERYRQVATELTADEFAAEFDVRPGTLTSWGTRGKVRKRRREADGKVVYNVADALAMMALRSGEPVA